MTPTVSCSTTPSGVLKVAPGAATSISATANGGYVMVGSPWSVVSGSPVVTGTNPITVTLNTGDATVEANATNPPGTHILTIAATAGCHTTPSGATVVAAATPISISAVADAGYAMPGTGVWTLISGTATFGNANLSATTVTLASDATIQAHVIP